MSADIAARFIFRIKQLLFWIGYRLDQWLPLRLCVAARNRFLPWCKPVLDVVELHIADHCNLNCTGCLHFTPLASKWFAKADDVAHDLAALRGKFRYIRHVTLLGGEPLLNADYPAIVAAVKNVSPESLITLVTNGIMFNGKAFEKFLLVCKEFGVRVKWTVYPPLAKRREEIVRAFKSAGVPMFTVDVDDFYVKMRPAGGNAKSAFRFCRKTTYCPYLRDGRIYACAQAYHIRDYISAYERDIGDNTEMCADAGLNVHDQKLDGWRIAEYLMTPCGTCRFCSDKPRFIPWSNGAKNAKEWIAQ